MAAKKPGVMIYFETGQAIKGLDYETKGRLFEAIMEYAEFGTVPPMDGVLAAVWPFIASKIDRDAKSYEKTVTGRKRAAYAKWWPAYAEKYGLDPRDNAAKERWIDQQIANHADATSALLMDANDANASDAMQTMPTVTTTVTGTGTTTVTGTGTATGAGTTGAEPAHGYGRYQNVILTEKEYNALLSEIPNVYGVIEKLSLHMQSTGRRYESHEATIRKWAQEDAEKKAKQDAQARRNSGNVFLDIVEGGAV